MAKKKKTKDTDGLSEKTCVHTDADGRCGRPDDNCQGAACHGCEDRVAPAEAVGAQTPREGGTWTDPDTGETYQFEVGQCKDCAWNKKPASQPCPKVDGKVICEASEAGFDKLLILRPAKSAETKKQGRGSKSNTPALLDVMARTPQEIPLAALVGAPWNARGEISAESVEDLVASIRAVGLIQRVTVMRDSPDDVGERFVVLAGHRRVAACRISGIDPVPCEVVSCDELQARMITAVENLHRADLSAMQEAEAVSGLLAVGMSAESVAAQTGRHVRWVYRRASILSLTSAWREAAHGYGLCAAFLEAVARYPAETQDGVYKSISESSWATRDFFGHGGDVKRIVGYFAQQTADVAKAPWAKAAPDWCAGCLKRSGVSPDLFGEDTEGDRCLDRTCWDAKVQAHIENERARLADKHGVECKAVPRSATWGMDTKGRKDRDHTRPVIVSDGDEAGKVLWVSDKAARGGDGAGGPATPDKEQRRKASVCRYMADLIDSHFDRGEVLPSNPMREHQTGELLEFVMVTGTVYGNGHPKPSEWEDVKAKSHDELADMVWERVAPVLRKRVKFFKVGECEAYYDEACAIAERVFGMSKDELDEAAERKGK